MAATSQDPEVIIDLRDGETTDDQNPILDLVKDGDIRESETPDTVVNRRRPESVTVAKPGYDRVKRLFDIVLGLAALTVAAPVLVLGVLAVKLTSPGPVFFSQDRVGHEGRTFKIFKLRSMFIDADHRQQRAFNEAELRGELAELKEFQLGSDPRITPVGGFLRRTSIDELPQLLNVIKGDMSLVGPRPSCTWEVELFEPRFRQRHDVLPGITGLWQVEGRRTIDMTGMLELDIVYIQRRSTWLDIKILARTLPAVLSGTGAG